MNMKEKLVELIYDNSPRLLEEEAKLLASRLIAHGVTMQEWIPVTEQMPELHMNEDGIDCTHGKIVFRSDLDKTVHLVYCIKGIYRDTCSGVKVELYRWYDTYGNQWEDITHWMPLPPAPEGK